MAISSFSFPHICFDVKTKHIPGNILLFVLVRFVSNQCQHLLKDFTSYAKWKYFFALVIISRTSAELILIFIDLNEIMLALLMLIISKRMLMLRYLINIFRVKLQQLNNDFFEFLTSWCSIFVLKFNMWKVFMRRSRCCSP